MFKLCLNIVKTEYRLIDSPYNIENLSFESNVFVGDDLVRRVRAAKALGIHIDEHLTWENHIDYIYSGKITLIIYIIHLMCAPEGNSEFCFPESLNVSRDEVEGNIETRGKTKLTISRGSTH